MKRLSCIIFDLDGTLVNTSELIYATFNHVADKYLNRVFTPKEIVAMFGPPEDVAIERFVGKERIAEAMEDFCQYHQTHLPRLADAYEGIRELLGFLKSKGVILAVFTGRGRRTALIILEKIGISSYFDLIVTGTDVASFKPSPEGIHMVLKAFNLKPGEALMVGDSVADVEAAAEAGVPMAAALWDSYGKELVLKMDPEYRFTEVGDLADWLKEQLSQKRSIESSPSLS